MKFQNYEEYLDEGLPDPVQEDKPTCTKIVADLIHRKDFGYRMFNQASGKAILSVAHRREIVERGSIYFQSSEPCAHKNNQLLQHGLQNN